MNQSKFFALSIYLTVASIFAFSGSVQATVTCRSLFGDSRYGQLHEDFILNTAYKVEVPEQSEIKNQCNLGTCHLYAWVSQLEHDVKVNSNKSIKISAHHLSAIHWYRESISLLEDSSKDKVTVSLGANSIASKFSILQSGIIPDQAWTGARDFHTGALSSRMGQYVQNVIAKAKWDMNAQTDKNKKNEIKQKAQMQISEIFANVIGDVPQSFMYEGKQYTPHSFQQTFFPDLFQPMTLMAVAEDRKLDTVLQAESPAFKVVTTNIDVLEKTARALLDQGRNVYLGYDHNSDFVDVKTGTMSIAAFNIPPGGEPLTREQRMHFKITPGGHAVQIVGYDFDPKTNQVTQWKIKNSWGDKVGDVGYFHMYQDFFKTFVMWISYSNDTNVSPEIHKVAPQQFDLNF